MQKHPMLSVKEAAELLRLDERSVRERLINGQLKGEKKNVGLREKWFVYSGSVEAAISKQGGFVGDIVGLQDVTVDSEDVYDATDSDGSAPLTDRSERDDWIEANRDKMKVLAEELMRPLMEKMEVQAEVIFEQKQALADQARQLKLLPDLQKQAEQRAKAVELKHVENEALKKQVAALQEQLEASKEQLETASKRTWWQKLFMASDAK